MLSLLSLLFTSGTVLRADTKEWTPDTYPDPRTNSTLCNTLKNSTLCDPDHILTDYWRAEINKNINKQIEKLKDSNIQYTDKASPSCFENTTEPIQIYVLLAKRIQTTNNQTITEIDLTTFGNELAQKYGFEHQLCKNFLLLIGIEAAKLAYVRTGRDLKLPADLMQRVFREYNLFNAKNYMEGLNKIVVKIGEQMLDPFKDTEELIKESTTSINTTVTENKNDFEETFQQQLLNFTSQEIEKILLMENNNITKNFAKITQLPNSSWLIIAVLGISILTAIFSLTAILISHIKQVTQTKILLQRLKININDKNDLRKIEGKNIVDNIKLKKTGKQK